MTHFPTPAEKLKPSLQIEFNGDWMKFMTNQKNDDNGAVVAERSSELILIA